MKRWERPLLLFSLALNAGFVSIAATRSYQHPEARAPYFGPETPHSAQRWERFRERRHAAMAQRLDLDPQQLHVLDSDLDRFRSDLRDLRSNVVQERQIYAQALVNGDVPAARIAARRVSRAQARVDSLCAEAMLRETQVLTPEQRARYARWAFRGSFAGIGAGRPFEGPRRHGHALDSTDSPNAPLPHEERTSP
jgi:Spy/CpxP family protein refolding chaperone